MIVPWISLLWFGFHWVSFEPSPRLKWQRINLENLMDWDLSPLTGPSWLVGCFMRRVGRQGNVLHSNSLPWKRGRSGWRGFGTTSLTLIYSCYFPPNCSLKIWISSRQKSQDYFFPSISWEGGGQNQRTFIFFSVSSTVSKSLSGKQIKLQLNLSRWSESSRTLSWNCYGKKGGTCQTLKCYCIPHVPKCAWNTETLSWCWSNKINNNININ